MNLKKCYDVVFSGSGSLLVSLSRDVVAWDVLGRVKRFRSHPLSHPSSCAIHPDEQSIVIKNTTGSIAIIDSCDGAIVRIFNSKVRNEGSNILYSSCGDYIVDGSWNGEIMVRSAATGNVAFHREFPGEMITRVTRSAGCDRWYFLHQPKSISRDLPFEPAYVSVWEWPFTSPTYLRNLVDGRIHSISISPDGERICIVGQDVISVMSLAEKRILASTQYTFGGTAFVAEWSPDSREIATVQDEQFVFYFATNLEKRKTVELQFASDVAYSPDGTLIALGSWEAGKLIEWSPVSMQAA
jgi:WD40 repeat protein